MKTHYVARKYLFYYKKTTLKSVYKDMYWPADT